MPHHQISFMPSLSAASPFLPVTADRLLPMDPGSMNSGMDLAFWPDRASRILRKEEGIGTSLTIETAALFVLRPVRPSLQLWLPCPVPSQ